MITIYSKKNCPNCVKAKEYLKNINIEFNEVDVETNAEARNQLIEEGHRSVPQIYCDGLLLVKNGYSGLVDIGEIKLKQLLSELEDK